MKASVSETVKEAAEEAAKEAATPVLELSDGETVPEEPEEGPNREEGLKEQGKTEVKAED